MIKAADTTPGAIYRFKAFGAHTYVTRQAQTGAELLSRLRKNRSKDGPTSRRVWMVSVLSGDPTKWVVFTKTWRVRGEDGKPKEIPTTVILAADASLRPLQTPPPYPKRR